jgi:spermidine synthase
MRLIAPFTFIAFFLSGISALIYELTWVRSLKHVFGSDSLALSSMLTVFIGGIALGTFISGKLIEHYFRFDNDLDDQSQQSLNLGQAYSLMFSYCTVELLLGLYALLIPCLLGPCVLGNIWSVFAAYALDNVVAGSLLKFVISSLFLLIPTMLMGISFPLLTELLAIHNGKNFTAHHTDQFAAANLYATNTLGAIVGAIVGGFYLLPHVGLNNSAYLASLINIFIGIFCSLWFLINHQSFRGANPLKVLSFINTAAEKLNSAMKMRKNIKKLYQHY